MNLETIDRDIAETRKAIAPLTQKLEQLNRQRDKLRSQEFISVNGIRKEDVQMSAGEGVPWFGTTWQFGRWLLNSGCKKRWAEWNGRIYHAADLMDGRMPDMPATVDDLPE